MNERIKALSDIAYKNHLKNNPHSSFGRRTDYDKEFAELIIRECAEFARQHNLDNAERSHMIHKAIKAHFGVE
jgi:hypothetical protein